MAIDTAVIPVAGLGTRMLPATKEQPKEMLPVPVHDPRYGLVFKPFLHLVFEKLYEAGVRRFIFVVGRGKRSIEDYFTPDWGFTQLLRRKGKEREARLLEDFYAKLEDSVLVWVNQPEPRGFGDAVYRGSLAVGNKEFIVHAGDIVVVDPSTLSSKSLALLIEVYKRRRPDALLLIRRVEDPRHYGVAVVEPIEHRVYSVSRVVEKPRKPPSNMAIAAIYVFTPCIREALSRVKPGARGEIELTDAIQALIEGGRRVEAVEALETEAFIDIGRPETYTAAYTLLTRNEQPRA